MTISMIRTALIFLVGVKLVVLFQNDYTLKHERIEIMDYNKDFLEKPKVVLFWYNRTVKAFNASVYVKQNLGNDQWVNLTVEKFSSNQYRLYPLEFRKQPCPMLRNNLFGIQDVAKLANVTNCPILKGYYELNNIIPDVSKFPPHLIPLGKYRICGSSFLSFDHIATVCWQGEVQAISRF